MKDQLLNAMFDYKSAVAVISSPESLLELEATEITEILFEHESLQSIVIINPDLLSVVPDALTLFANNFITKKLVKDESEKDEVKILCAETILITSAMYDVLTPENKELLQLFLVNVARVKDHTYALKLLEDKQFSKFFDASHIYRMAEKHAAILKFITADVANDISTEQLTDLMNKHPGAVGFIKSLLLDEEVSLRFTLDFSPIFIEAAKLFGLKKLPDHIFAMAKTYDSLHKQDPNYWYRLPFLEALAAGFNLQEAEAIKICMNAVNDVQLERNIRSAQAEERQRLAKEVVVEEIYTEALIDADDEYEFWLTDLQDEPTYESEKDDSEEIVEEVDTKVSIEADGEYDSWVNDEATYESCESDANEVEEEEEETVSLTSSNDSLKSFSPSSPRLFTTLSLSPINKKLDSDSPTLSPRGRR